MRMRYTTLALALCAASCGDSTAPPKPAILELIGSAPVTAEAGSVLPALSVVVKDESGRALSGQPLTLSVSGGGNIAGGPTKTVSSPTPLGTWTLGAVAGPNTLTITSGTLPPITVSVSGIAGPPARFTTTTPTTAASVAGEIFPVTLTLFDRFDNPAAGIVNFATTGGGQLSTATATADAGGAVVVPTWRLGTQRGSNTLTATSGAATITFTVSAQAGAPAALEIVDGNNQSGFAGTQLDAVRVAVTDRYGNGVPRQNVEFRMGAGGGTLAGAGTVATDTNGIALAPAWTLGKRNVPQRLAVTSAGITKTIDADVRSSFKVTLRYFSAMSEEHRQVFEAAASRLTAMITSGAPPVQVAAFPVESYCGIEGAAPLTELVDGIVIYASIAPIDGEGKILARAGPCGFRKGSDRYLPAFAAMEYDLADLARLTRNGSLEDVVLHEMMHGIGFGTLWSTNSLIAGRGTSDPRYLGSAAIADCRANGGTLTCGATVPLENIGGAGTVSAHWREATFANEIMTGYLNAGANPVSTMSIASLIDLGYGSNTFAADAYWIDAGIRARPQLSPLTDEPWEVVHVRPEARLLESFGDVLGARVVR